MEQSKKFNPVVWYQPEMTEKDVFNKARELMKDNTTDAEALYTYMCKVKYQELQTPAQGYDQQLDSVTGKRIHTFIENQSKLHKQALAFLKTLEDIVLPKEDAISEEEAAAINEAISSTQD